MEENDIQAAAEQPAGTLQEEAQPEAESPSGEQAVEPASEQPEGETSQEAADPDTVEAEALSAEQILGEQAQPAPVSDSQAAELKAVLEAIVYVLNEPMPASQIAQALDRPLEEVEPILRQLTDETSRADRGIFIREVAGGYQMATKPEHHEVLRNFVKNLKQPLKLSQAALETLAVIAYKQPITMPEILEIRGVQGGGVVKTLIDRKLITTAGRKNVIGKPMQYKTSKEFLTQFGLKDVHELPSLKEFEEIRRQSIADEEFGPAEQQTLEEQAATLITESVSTVDDAPAADPAPAENESAATDAPAGGPDSEHNA